jgi:glycosyltransferase involved in cell wall biosynthesis
MRILLVTPWYAPAYAYGGIVRVAEDHARELARRGYDVTVATTDAHDRDHRNPVREETIDDVRVVRFANVSNTLANRANLYSPLGFDRWIRAHIGEFDRLIAHDVYTWLTFRALRYAAAADVPYAIMPHGTISGTRIAMKHSSVKRWLLARLRPYLRGAFATYTISDAECEDIRSVEPAARAVTLGNGIDLASVPAIDRESAKRSLGIAPEAFTTIFLGRLHPLKRADVALRAHALLRQERPENVLLVAGPDDGALTDLRHLADSLSLGDSVRFLGTLTGYAKFEALSAADAFISPSLDE